MVWRVEGWGWGLELDWVRYVDFGGCMCMINGLIGYCLEVRIEDEHKLNLRFYLSN